MAAPIYVNGSISIGNGVATIVLQTGAAPADAPIQPPTTSVALQPRPLPTPEPRPTSKQVLAKVEPGGEWTIHPSRIPIAPKDISTMICNIAKDAHPGDKEPDF
jgi:hypothetical protein